MITARAVNNEQEEEMKELTRAHKSIKKVYKLLVHQLLVKPQPRPMSPCAGGHFGQ